MGWVGSKLTVTVLQWLKWIVEEDAGRYFGPGSGSVAPSTWPPPRQDLAEGSVLFHASSSEWDVHAGYPTLLNPVEVRPDDGIKSLITTTMVHQVR